MAKAPVQTRLELTITRANGRVERIGVMKGGHWYEHLLSRIRLIVANWRAARGI
jgi:hypothetical protein